MNRRVLHSFAAALGLLLACRGPVAAPPAKEGPRGRSEAAPREQRPTPAPPSIDSCIAKASSLIEGDKIRAAVGYLQDAIEGLKARANEGSSEQDLSRWRGIAELAGRARAFEEQVIARQRLLELLALARGAQDPELLAAKVELAEARAAAGDHAQARALLGEALAVAVTTMPESAELLLRARHALANTLFVLEEPLAASFEIEPVLAIRASSLPPGDPLLQRTKLDAAQIRRANGDLEGARLLLEEVLAQGSTGLARAETAAARVELAEARVEVAISEEVRSLLSELQSGVELQRLPAKNPLLRRMELLGTRLDELEELDRLEQTADPAGQDLPKRTETSARAALRHQRLISTFSRLRPRESARPNLELDQAIVAGAQAGAIPSPGSWIPGMEGLTSVGQEAAGYVPGLLRATPYWAQGLPGELGGKIATSIAAAQTATTLYQALTERSKQIEYLEEGLPADDPRLFDARLQLAQEAWGLEGPRLSLEMLEQLLEQSEAAREPDDPALVEAKWQLALTKHELGDLEGAQPLLVEVLEAREGLLDRLHPELHETLATLAWNHLELGQTFEARVHTTRLLEHQRERVRDSWCLAPREAREAAHVELRRLAELLSLVDALDSPEVFERDVFAILESLRLLSTWLPPAQASTPEVAARRREASRLRSELSDLCQVVPSDPHEAHEWSQRVRTIQTRLDELGQAILGADPALADLLGRVGAGPMQEVLGPEAAYLGFWRNVRTFPRPRGQVEPVPREPRYTAFLVRAGEFRRVELGSSSTIEELARSYRAALMVAGPADRGIALVEPSPDGAFEAGQKLHSALLEPLWSSLAGVRQLHLCLDDALHLVPLEALTLADGELLGERFEVRHELSPARLLTPPTPRAPGAALLTLCGGIDYDSEPSERDTELVTAPLGERSEAGAGFRALPGMKTEVEALAALYARCRSGEVRLLTGSGASKAALREQVQGAEYVHLATHGWFASEGLPSRWDEGPLGTRSLVRGFAPLVLCGLALAGANRGADERGRVPGILTAEELAGFDLSAAELVVLSACETGLGVRRHGQGVQSLQTALLAAGARSTLTSLWRVDDAATAIFMEVFYRALWQDGLDQASALRHARRELRQRGHPPRDWATWVLYGAARE